MLIYWLMFGIPGLFALNEHSDAQERKRVTFLWLVAASLLTLIIGFRWKTGGDWSSYYRNYLTLQYEDFSLSLTRDMGFSVLNYFASATGLGFMFITLFSGVVMGIGLTRFCLAQPRPWLGFAVAVPYLVMVLGMGYIRQGIAISFLMIGLAALGRGKVLQYSLWAAVGALFHSTAAILVPLGVVITNRNRILTLVLGLGMSILVFNELLAPKIDQFTSGYVDAEMDSSGAVVRLLMTALPAALFLAYKKHFYLDVIERRAWSILSWAAMALLIAVFVSPSSTVIDRIGLYLLPLQTFMYARVPDALGKTDGQRRMISLGIVALYATALFTWLFFATHSHSWKPYRFYFFEDGVCIECRDR